MIEQNFKQAGLLQEKLSTSIFPTLSDLILIFFPTPGVYIRDILTVPEKFKTEAVDFYDEEGIKFDDLYVFIPAIKQKHYKNTGLAYTENTLHFEPELMQFLLSLSLNIIEHRYS